MSFGGLSVRGEWTEEAWQVAQMTWSRVLHSGVSSFTPAAGSGFLSSCQKSFEVIVVVVVIASLVLGAKIVVIVWG